VAIRANRRAAHIGSIDSHAKDGAPPRFGSGKEKRRIG
jgi:hypothetical protein